MVGGLCSITWDYNIDDVVEGTDVVRTVLHRGIALSIQLDLLFHVFTLPEAKVWRGERGIIEREGLFGWGQAGRWCKLSCSWDVHSSVFYWEGKLESRLNPLKAHICDVTQNAGQLTRYWLREGTVV